MWNQYHPWVKEESLFTLFLICFQPQNRFSIEIRQRNKEFTADEFFHRWDFNEFVRELHATKKKQ